VLTILAPVGTQLRLRNSYSDELINCLHLWVRASAPLMAPATEVQTVFQELRANELQELVSTRLSGGPLAGPLPFSLSIGRFNEKNSLLGL
jgi:hypothetical protein